MNHSWIDKKRYQWETESASLTIYCLTQQKEKYSLEKYDSLYHGQVICIYMCEYYIIYLYEPIIFALNI